VSVDQLVSFMLAVAVVSCPFLLDTLVTVAVLEAVPG
jgi:hypothetical protein